MIRCVGSIDDQAPCTHRPFHQVTSRAQVNALPVCKYHMYDIVDQISSQGFPAVVVRVG